MRNYTLSLLIIILFAAGGFSAVSLDKANLFGSDDLHLSGAVMSSYKTGSGRQILSFTDGFELFIGDNHLKSSDAVVWLEGRKSEYQGIVSVDYTVTVYLQGKVKTDKGPGSKTAGLELAESRIADVESMVAQFAVGGEVLATADKRLVQDIRTSSLYRNAMVATGQVKLVGSASKRSVLASADQSEIGPKAKRPGFLARLFGASAEAPVVAPQPPAPKFQYPVNISSLGSEAIKFTNETLADSSSIATIINRFYMWQKQDELGGLLEFQADSAVVFYVRKSDSQNSDANMPAGEGMVKAVYLRGDVIMTESGRTITADEMYYDFQAKQALAVNAVMKTYDSLRGVPIYLRAQKLRQLSENKFKGEDILLTNSEFYVPRIAMTASEIIVTDLTPVDQEGDKTREHRYDILAKDVRFSLDGRTMFYMPKMHSDISRADMPLRAISIGHNSDYGMMVETDWYLDKVLGMRDSEGVDSTLALDYYSSRGAGVGAIIEYQKQNYFGKFDGYIMRDTGKDDLGRNRENIEPPRELRGRFKLQHRQFMPYDWQLTLEGSYLSDENILESLNREEFMTSKEQETVVHLKRLKENWAFSVLGKWRVNDFANQLEELPSAQYHLKAESIFDDRLVSYHDASLGRYRQRIDDESTLNISQEDYTFGYWRSEIDLPLKLKNSTNVVPYIAGTFGYDDRSGFAYANTINADAAAGEKKVFIGEIGVRASTQFWKLYPNIRSEKWDINGIRHIVKPYANIAMFTESEDTVTQKDMYNLGILQRWQTKRGSGDKERIVEWMRLNLDFTWVSDDSDVARPDQVIWNSPFVPMPAMSATEVFNSNLVAAYRRFELFGPQRDTFNADYIWRVSDTTSVLSGLNYDLKDNNVEQFNIGMSRLCWPNLSYYIGGRYLRSTQVDGQVGSNACTFAVSYKINPRYSIAFAHQHDFDYGKRVYSQISLIRRYRRVFYSLTASFDESLDRTAIMLSIWPEGIGEFSSGDSSYKAIDSAASRNY